MKRKIFTITVLYILAWYADRRWLPEVQARYNEVKRQEAATRKIEEGALLKSFLEVD